MIRNNVKVLYKFITENVDVNEVADESIKLQLKEDVFSEHPEFKREIKFLMDNWDTFLSQVDAVIQLNRNFNTEEEDANNLVDKVTEILGDIKLGNEKEVKEGVEDQKVLKFMDEDEQQKAFKVFLDSGSKDKFEGFIKAFGEDIFDAVTERPVEVGGSVKINKFIREIKELSVEELIFKGLVRLKRRGFGAGTRYEFRDRDGIFTVAPSKEEAIKRVRQVIASGDVTSLFKKTHPGVVEAKEDPIVIVNDKDQFWTGSNFAEEFPEAMLFSTVGKARKALKFLKDKNIGDMEKNKPQIIVNSGLENERVLEAKKETRTQKKVKAAFKEVKKDEPSIVTKTRKKEGEEAANKQKIAIALSKARKTGAKIPEKPTKESIEDKHVDSSLANDIVVRGFFKDIHFFKPEDLEKIDIDSIVDGIIDEHGFNTGNVALAILSGRDFREQNLGDLEIIQKELKGDLAKQLKGFIEGNITRAIGELEHDKVKESKYSKSRLVEETLKNKMDLILNVLREIQLDSNVNILFDKVNDLILVDIARRNISINSLRTIIEIPGFIFLSCRVEDVLRFKFKAEGLTNKDEVKPEGE